MTKPTKKQKVQKSSAQDQPWPNDSVTLREAGKKLQQLKPNESISNSNAYNVLLKLLQSGELSAGFFVTSDSHSRVTIPKMFWLSVHSMKFKKILNQSNQDEPFVARGAEFSDQIADIFVKQVALNSDTTRRDLTSFISNRSRGYEPDILKTDWDAFLAKIGQSDPAAKVIRISSGRNQLESWSDFAAYVLGYCLTKKATSSTAQSGIYEAVIESAKRDGADTSRWPGSSSSRDYLKKAFDFAGRLEKKSK